MLIEAINTYVNTGALACSFRETLVASQRINWRIEDIIGADKPLDFAKPHFL